MIIHGFQLVDERYVAEIKSQARLYRHVQTGAQLLSLINDDENKVFGITFRTPPKDSTGVAHILEHSVLCGSRKYPVKEPFVELLKSSLKTFLNAFTYPDKTCYPVASQNTQDFYNLIDVYLDAVFFPNLTPEVLMQEGWHFEAESESSPLTIQGVVFGEMKGVYSSPDSVLGETTQQSLFPDNTYGLDSGGNPRDIPRLTFEAFKAFHENYYHPSNARVYFWGDDDPDERLRLVDAYLQQFQAKKIDSTIAIQQPFSSPRYIEKKYASSEPSETDRAMVTVNWLLPEVTDPQTTLAFQILDHALLGTPASPLRKALIDSGLGEDLTGAGVETDLRQMYFSTGLKGIDRNRAEDVETLITKELQALVDQGIPRDLLDASLHSTEFHLREANTGSYPRGLIFMLQSLRSWLYDADPLGPLAFEKPLESIKAKVREGGYFEKLIRDHLLENPHRSRVLLVPDPEEGARRDAQEQQFLSERRKGLTDDDVRQVMEQARHLKERQQTPDSEEALATIPTLSIEDLPRLGKRIAQERLPLGTQEEAVCFHDQNTFGIAYLDIAFDMSVVPQQDIPLLPLFGRALLETGTAQQDFVTLSRRISANTGGIWPDMFLSTTQQGTTSAWFMLRGKAMLDKGEELTRIMREVLQSARFEDRERIRQLLLEEKAQMEMGIIPSGHGMVDARIRSRYSEAAWLSEQTGGISYLFFVRDLLSRFEEMWPSVLERLQGLRRRLFNQRHIRVNITLDEAGLGQFKPHVEALFHELPNERVETQTWDRSVDLTSEGQIGRAHV